MRKIIFATNNKNKLAEILPFLQEFAVTQLGQVCEVLTFADLGVDIDVEEGETSLYINAAKKAMESYNELVEQNLINKDDIVVAEDSGLFGYKESYPGVLTKRIMNKVGLESMLTRFRINELPEGSFSHNKAEAFYESAMAFYSKNIQILTKATEEGYILSKPTGDFNYPIDKYFESKKRGFLGNIVPEEFSKTSFRLEANVLPASKIEEVFEFLKKLNEHLKRFSKDYNSYEFAVKSDTNDADYSFTTVQCSKHDIALLKALEENNCECIYDIYDDEEDTSQGVYSAILHYRQLCNDDLFDLSFSDDEIESYLYTFLGYVEPYSGYNSCVYGTTAQIETIEELHEIQYLEEELNKLLSSTNISKKLKTLGGC